MVIRMSSAVSLLMTCSPPPAVRTVLVWRRFFHPAATSGGSRSESVPGWWASRSFQNHSASDVARPVRVL